MEKFKNMVKINEGTFGIVYKADDEEEVVAIKEMKAKYTNWEECKNLREVKSLINLKHENIVKLKEVNLDKETLYLVFEFMDKNLYDLISVLSKKNKKFTEAQIKYIMYQVLNGIAYMHRYGFFHRDMKPENLLVKGESVKIADFGLAREIRSLPPYSDYVSTRWYRAPECLLKAPNYNSPIDLWAIGAIMAELYTLKPLFPGTSEKDQLFKICSVVGNPANQWRDAINLSKKIDFKFPNVNGIGIKAAVPDASDEAVEVISELLKWDPNKRATASKILTFPFFTKINVNTKISMILNDNSDGYYNYNMPSSIQTNAKVQPNTNNTNSYILDRKAEENEIDKMIEELKGEDSQKRSPQINKNQNFQNNNTHLKFDNFDDLITNKADSNPSGGGFNFNQVPKQLYYTTLKKTNKFDSSAVNTGVNESNFPNKSKKFNDFDDEFFIGSSSNANFRGSGITSQVNYQGTNLSQTVPKKEKIGSDNTLKPTFNVVNLDEKEQSPGRIGDKNPLGGKNRLKSALKFIEESFDIKKEIGNNLGSTTNNNKLDINTSIGGQNLARDRTLSNKKDSALKFMEENLLFGERTKENSPPRNNSGGFQAEQEVGEYVFESRRKKR